MKKTATAFLITAGLLVGSATPVWATDTQIQYNDVSQTTNYPIIVQSDRTLMAVRDAARILGTDIDWNDSTRIASLTYGDRDIKFQPDLQRVIVNDIAKTVDVGPQIIDDRIYLPFRVLFELTDNDVIYQQKDDRAVIRVYSRDFYSNYTKREGSVTTAPIGLVEYDKAVLTRDGNMTELKMTGSTLSIHQTTKMHGITTENEEHWIPQKQVTDVIDIDGKYFALFDMVQNANYVGTGYRPAESPIVSKIYTPQGEYQFSRSGVIADVYDLDGNEGYVKKELSGYLLDITKSTKPILARDYAFANNTFGFLTDGQFLLINRSDAKGYHFVSCQTISETMQQGKLFYNPEDTFFYAIGFESSDDKHLYVSAYTSASGMKTLSYIPIQGFTAQDGIQILDSYQNGNKAYLLLSDGEQRLLACYDLTNRVLNYNVLDLPYDSFVSAEGITQLYYADKQFHHFYAFE